MPSILYGGVRYNQVRHAIYCKKCKETIESKSLHDFKWCSCHSIGVDGGITAGNRVLGSLWDMEDRSVYIYKADRQAKKVYLPPSVLEERLEEMRIKTDASKKSKNPDVYYPTLFVRPHGI